MKRRGLLRGEVVEEVSTGLSEMRSSPGVRKLDKNKNTRAPNTHNTHRQKHITTYKQRCHGTIRVEVGHSVEGLVVEEAHGVDIIWDRLRALSVHEPSTNADNKREEQRYVESNVKMMRKLTRN